MSYDSNAFDKDGWPKKSTCTSIIRSLPYENQKQLYSPPVKRYIGGTETELEFMHIPKTGGTFLTQYKNHFPPWHDGHPELLIPELNCTDPAHAKDSICKCPGWHVAPRFYVPSVFEGKSTFCFVRDPLERLVSEWKMEDFRHLDSNYDSIVIKGREGKYDLVKELNHFLKKLSSKVNMKLNTLNCHLRHQYEWIWDSQGKQTCHHVLRYEDGVERGYNSVMDAYLPQTAQYKRMNISSTSSSSSSSSSGRSSGSPINETIVHHAQSNISIYDVEPEIAAAVRRLYVKDYCLLGYAANRPLYQRESLIDYGSVDKYAASQWKEQQLVFLIIFVVSMVVIVVRSICLKS